jgi:hypothetical protein
VRVNPHGTLIVGLPYTSNGSVLRIKPGSDVGCASASSTVTGMRIAVGRISTSTPMSASVALNVLRAIVMRRRVSM